MEESFIVISFVVSEKERGGEKHAKILKNTPCEIGLIAAFKIQRESFRSSVYLARKRQEQTPRQGYCIFKIPSYLYMNKASIFCT